MYASKYLKSAKKMDKLLVVLKVFVYIDEWIKQDVQQNK